MLNSVSLVTVFKILCLKYDFNLIGILMLVTLLDRGEFYHLHFSCPEEMTSGSLSVE